MADQIVCDAPNCLKIATFRVQELREPGYMFTGGTIDWCMEHLEAWKYTGGGGFVYEDEDDG